MNSALRIKKISWHLNQNLKIFTKFSRTCSNQTTEEKFSENTSKQGGYAKAFKKFETELNTENKDEKPRKTFASLLRNSNFIDVSREK